MLSRQRTRRTKRQSARHTQVQQQQALAQVHQQVFAPAPDTQDLSPRQACGVDPQGPAQGFAQSHRDNACTSDACGKAQTGDFNLG